MNALQVAVDQMGGQAALASALGVKQQHVWNWLSRGRVPAEHCPAIERVTAGKVRCEDLRPDVDWGVLRTACPLLDLTVPVAPAPANQPEEARNAEGMSHEA